MKVWELIDQSSNDWFLIFLVMWLLFMWSRNSLYLRNINSTNPSQEFTLSQVNQVYKFIKAFKKSVTLYLIFSCLFHIGSYLCIFTAKCLILPSVPLMSVKYSDTFIIFNLISSVVLYKIYNLWSCFTLLFLILLLLPLSNTSLMTSARG